MKKINKEEKSEIVTRLYHLPKAVNHVINLHASMTFDYAPDFDEDVKKDIRRAKQLGVEFSYNDSSIYDAGYVSGTVGQILKFIYMSPHLRITNRKYSSGIEYEAGVTLNIDKHDLRKITPAQFTEFVNWMGASFPDFIDGIKENDQLSKLYKQ